MKYGSAGNTEPTTIPDRPATAERETERMQSKTEGIETERMQSKTEEPETEGTQQVLHDRNSATWATTSRGRIQSPTEDTETEGTQSQQQVLRDTSSATWAREGQEVDCLH